MVARYPYCQVDFLIYVNETWRYSNGCLILLILIDEVDVLNAIAEQMEGIINKFVRNNPLLISS